MALNWAYSAFNPFGYAMVYLRCTIAL